MNTSDFNQPLMFRAIINKGNISKAAKKPGITSPSVSNSLKDLEHGLGMPLTLYAHHADDKTITAEIPTVLITNNPKITINAAINGLGVGRIIEPIVAKRFAKTPYNHLLRGR